MLAVRQEFSRHSARPNGWQRVFPLQSSQRHHLPLFRQAGDLTTKLAAVVASNPNFGQGPLSLKDQSKTPPTFVVEPIEGPQLRRQFKVWKKTKKKKDLSPPSLRSRSMLTRRLLKEVNNQSQSWLSRRLRCLRRKIWRARTLTKDLSSTCPLLSTIVLSSGASLFKQKLIAGMKAS